METEKKETGSFMIISILKKALHPSYKGRKQAFFYSDLEAFGFHNRPHHHLYSPV